LYVR
jgi:DNA-binding transcriptional regulator YdaS (Cro superfamily)